MKNLLFTGASGFIGSHFHKVIPNENITNIDLKKPIFEHSANYLQGDIRNSQDVEEAISTANPDVIISLAAEHKDFGIEESAYFKTNEFGMKVICNAASKFDIKKIIYYSSVAVYGNNTSPSTEDMKPNPANPYGASKLAAEKVLYKWAEEDRSRAVLIIRPVVVYGERNIANMYRLIDQIKKGRYFHIGEGTNVKSIAYVKNLVDATLYLMDRMQAGVDIYNYADEPQLSSRKIAEVITGALEKKSPITLPYWMVYTLGIPFDIAIKITKKDLPISTNRVKKFCTETFHKADKLRSVGFTPTFDNVQGLENMVDWYKNADISKEAVYEV